MTPKYFQAPGVKMRSRRRVTIVILSVAALLSSLTHVAGAEPGTSTPERRGLAPAAGSGTFVDDDGNVHEAMIEAITARGIAHGCSLAGAPERRYCPADVVTRGQMAAFLVRAFDLPASPGDTFRDDDSSIFEGDIEALASAGVTVGCNPPASDRFCPEDVVTRGQMAGFLARAAGVPHESTNQFVDDDGSVFEADIGAITVAGIAKGCNPPLDDRYCPLEPVRRDQMASFLGRALGLSPLIP
jgi:hypothetical protein